MLTEFGKICRKIRIDQDELLKDMADNLEVTPAYLSAVEVGKRNVPGDWPEKIATSYKLDEHTYKLLKTAAENSQLGLKFDFKDMNVEDKDLVLAFARELQAVDSEKLKRIKKILI
jgi:transcriptional regulator with XRE-family HTH domain